MTCHESERRSTPNSIFPPIFTRLVDHSGRFFIDFLEILRSLLANRDGFTISPDFIDFFFIFVFKSLSRRSGLSFRQFRRKRPKLEECIFCRRWISGTLSSWLMLFCVTLLPYTSYCGARLDYERSEKWGEMGKCLRELAREYRKWEGERDERAEERGRVKAGTVRMKNSAKRGGRGREVFLL